MGSDWSLPGPEISAAAASAAPQSIIKYCVPGAPNSAEALFPPLQRMGAVCAVTAFWRCQAAFSNSGAKNVTGDRMLETLVTLLAAHLLSDFLLQTDSMVAKKSEIRTLLIHVCIVVGVTAFLVANLQSSAISILAVTFLSHLAMDAIKVYRMKDNAKSFIIDQAIHLLVIVALALLFPRVVQNGLWHLILSDKLPWYFAAMTLISGTILAVPAGGILIGKLTDPIREEIKESRILVSNLNLAATATSLNADDLDEGLSNGGRYIGWLERFLTLILILIGQPTGIGFLITAKSILRFGEINEARHRKLAEYIIIGTFLSFGWALSVAVVTKEAFDYWHPQKAKPMEKIQVTLDDKTSSYLNQRPETPSPTTPSPTTPSPTTPSPTTPSPTTPSPTTPSPTTPSPTTPLMSGPF